MKLFHLLFFLFFSVFTAVGQSLYEAGYFIDNSGVKTEALIKKLPWQDSPTEFEWKKTISSNVQTASIEDIKEFSVGEDYRFKRYILKFDLNGDSLGKSTRSENPNLKIRKVFLRLAVKSETSLYQYSQNNVHRFFYTNTSNVYPELLIYKVFYEDDTTEDLGEKIIPKENKKYIDQLKTMANCKNLMPEKVGYNLTDLKNYFVSYNECKGNDIDYVLRRKINQTRVGVIAAANLSRFNHLALQTSDQVINYKDSFSPRYGAFIESFIPFSKVDLSFFLEATYQSFSMEGNLILDGTENIIYTLDYKALSLALAPRFHIYLNPKFTLFLEGGIAVDINLNSELNPAGENVELQNAITHYFYGGGFGAGRLKIGVRFFTTRNISKDTRLPRTFLNAASIYAAFTLFGHKNKFEK
ncbi:hypothetical protein NBT05_16050 [Aquimarina sp. ERC-38]|uniref:hypothetical protein n=1 Tax=Aquimarina sp. ERC-38 TaxID=2949996 RepID=UPI00224595D0|nr:hypothetical protein [Aquimarina sp. ERC-38]UZO80451.1 hypothetical protein NBT05_16050 [Aquimarina sp. ERC-38]